MNIVISNDAVNIAGGENYVLYLAEGLREKNHHVIITPLINSELAIEVRKRRFVVYEIPYGLNGKEFNAVKVLYNYLRKEKVDVVHSNSNLDRTIAAFAGKFLGAKNFTTVHSCMSISRNLTHRFRNKYLIDRFTPVGYSTKNILTAVDRIPENKISVVHIGLPKEKFTYSSEGRKKIRDEFGIMDSEILIGTVSRLVEFKGHTFLLQAFKNASAQNPNLKLLIIGEGELEYHLRNLSKELQLEKKVFFAGHRKDIPDMLSAFDIFAQTSIDNGGETFPVSILEAISVGLPIIASDVGDIKYLVRNENGILLQPENVSQISESFIKLSSDRSLIEKYKSASRKLFEKEFTIDRMVNKIELHYLEEIDKHVN